MTFSSISPYGWQFAESVTISELGGESNFERNILNKSMFNWLTKFFEKRAIVNDPFAPFEGQPTLAGVNINETKALNISAVRCAVETIAWAIAGLPLKVYSKTDKQKQEARLHPLWSLLQTPNGEQTRFTFLENALSTCLLHGNFVAEIEKQGDGRPVAIWPLPIDKCSIKRDEEGRLYYVFQGNHGTVTYRPDEVFHIHGLGNGVWGYSTLKLARESLGLTLALEKYGSAFFGNGVRPSGALQHPKGLSDVARENIRKSFKDTNAGTSNAARLMILEEGMTFSPFTWNNEEFQFLDSRRFAIEEIARWFHISPTKLFALEQAHYNNIEHLSISFVVDTLQPWIIRIENEINRKLLLPSEKQNYFAEFTIDGLLRGDSGSRWATYQIARQNKLMLTNEIRAKENLPTIEGLDDAEIEALLAKEQDGTEQETQQEQDGNENIPDDSTE